MLEFVEFEFSKLVLLCLIFFEFFSKDKFVVLWRREEEGGVEEVGEEGVEGGFLEGGGEEGRGRVKTEWGLEEKEGEEGAEGGFLEGGAEGRGREKTACGICCAGGLGEDWEGERVREGEEMGGEGAGECENARRREAVVEREGGAGEGEGD